MTNFDYLYNTNRYALVDLLRCRSPWSNCQYCNFRAIGYSRGFCGRSDDFGEEDTIYWLAQEYNEECPWK